MRKVFEFYSDPSHGWAKVERAELIQLGILDKVSNYSYQRREYVYLEEDYDLNIFMKAYKNKFGYYPDFKDKFSNKNSKIRSYNHFNATLNI